MKILFTTLHAKYSHASLALPCLAACCRDISDVRLTIREYTINEPREHILKLIMAEHADVVAFSCYIWNIEPILKIASDIKEISPQTTVVLGGPEVSFEIFELMREHPAVDFVVKGEGEQVFRQLILAFGKTGGLPSVDCLESIGNLFFRADGCIVAGQRCNDNLQMDCIPSPFDAGLVDLDRPLTYYETSRGCPFSCAFCLSSVEGRVRSFSMERIRQDLLLLMRKNVPRIKLVDRTFNYDSRRADEIWRFILEHNRNSHFHFEIAADLLDRTSIELLEQVPADTFRFEIGIQSTSGETLRRVSRKSDLDRVLETVRQLRAETKVELHLDLIAGLPGEDYTAFLASLQKLAELQPHEIQVEPLKILKGSPMRSIAARENYRFSASPPYIVLRNPWLTFEEISRIEVIGRLLDLFFNHGGFTASLAYLVTIMPFAQLFDQMAGNAAGHSLSGLSSTRRYELFFRLASRQLDANVAEILIDALFYDFCRFEMPRQGKLPFFIEPRQHACSWPSRQTLPNDIDLPDGSRVKIFRFIFMKDYRSTAGRETATEISFAYASHIGGLKVCVF